MYDALHGRGHFDCHGDACAYQKVSLLANPHIPTCDLNAVARSIVLYRSADGDVVAHVVPARFEGCDNRQLSRRSHLHRGRTARGLS